MTEADALKDWNDKGPHRVMTPEEYAAIALRGRPHTGVGRLNNGPVFRHAAYPELIVSHSQRFLS